MATNLYKIYSSLPLDAIYRNLVSKLGSEYIGAIRLDYNWSADNIPSSSNRTICAADPKILELKGMSPDLKIQEYIVSPRSRPPRNLLAHIYIAYPPHLREQEDRFSRVFAKAMALVHIDWVKSHQIRVLDVRDGAIILFAKSVDLSTRVRCFVILEQLTWAVQDRDKTVIEVSRAVWCPRDLIPTHA